MDQNLTQHLRSLKTVHGALMAGVLLFLFISMFINYTEGVLIQEGNESLMIQFLFAANAMSVLSISGGLYIFNRRIKEIKTEETLLLKLTKYREAMIIRSATLESFCFIFVVCYFLFGSNVFFFEAIAGFVLLASFFPSNSRIAKEVDHDIREFY